MTEVEQDHIVDAFTFELGKVDVAAVVERMLERLALIDPELARRVGIGLGIPVEGGPEPAATEAAPSLAMVTDASFPVDGRVVHVLADDGADLAGISALKDALLGAGVTPHVIATHKGAISGAGDGSAELTVDRSFHTASSAEADAIVVAAGSGLASDPAAITYVQAAYRHLKTLGSWGDGAELLLAAGVDLDAPGVSAADDTTTGLADAIVDALGSHRHWERLSPHPTRTSTGA